VAELVLELLIGENGIEPPFSLYFTLTLILDLHSDSFEVASNRCFKRGIINGQRIFIGLLEVVNRQVSLLEHLIVKLEIVVSRTKLRPRTVLFELVRI
jgi:hypothetical protein